MAFQSKQPCLPPPSCPLEAGDSCLPQCPGSSASYQAKQPCVFPPNCVQPSIAEGVAAYAPTYASPCAMAPTVDLHSSPCASSAQPYAFVAEEAPPPAPAAVCTDAAAEASHAEPMLSYVTPGSTVRLNPSGGLSVEPGAATMNAGSVFVEPYTPHFL